MKALLKTFSLALIIAFCASCEREVIINPPESKGVEKSQLKIKSPKFNFDKRLFNEWVHENQEQDRVYLLQFHEYTNVLEIIHSKNSKDTYSIWATGDGKLKLVDQEDGVLEEWDYYFDEDIKGNMILFSKNINEHQWLKHELKSSKKWWNIFKRKKKAPTAYPPQK